MVARDNMTGQVTNPTPLDKDGNPVEPHIGTTTRTARPQQTVLTGYAQGGTTNPPQGDDGSVKHYAPTAADSKPGAVPGAQGVGSKESVAKHFDRAEKLAENDEVEERSTVADRRKDGEHTGAIDSATNEPISDGKK